jgi:hypothetical protein
MPDHHITKPKQKKRHQQQSESASQTSGRSEEQIQSAEETKESEQRATQAKGKKKKPKPLRRIERLRLWSIKWKDLLPVVFTALIFFVTVVYTIVSLFQWQEAIRTREIENRAYLNVKRIEMSKELTIGERPVAVITFFNTGRTPAQNTKVIADIGGQPPSAPEPDPRKVVLSRSAQSTGVISPEMDVQTPVDSNTVLTDELIYQINQDQIRLYIWGVASYEDMFGQSHKAYFCGVLRPRTRVFNICSQGNFAD